MKRYICYENEEVNTEDGWKSLFDRFGDKENFLDRDEWFTEMLFEQILVEV